MLPSSSHGNREDSKEIERLRAENEALKKPARGQMSLKVSEKGGLSVYGLGRFRSPFTKSSGSSSWGSPTKSARSFGKTTKH